VLQWSGWRRKAWYYIILLATSCEWVFPSEMASQRDANPIIFNVKDIPGSWILR